MHASHHHLHARRQAAADDHVIAVGRGDDDWLEFHRHGGGIEQPDRAGIAIPKQSTGGQLDRRLVAMGEGRSGNRHRGPQRQHLLAVHGELDAVGAGNGVGARRHFPHRTVQRLLAGPELHLCGRAHAQGQHLVFRHRKHHIARTILGDSHNRRSGRHHLAHLGIHCGHHAGHIRHQRGVAQLIALSAQLRLRLVPLRLGCLPGGFAPLQLGSADEVLLAQVLVALEVRRCQVPVGGGSGELCTRRVGRQLVILRVQLRQHLTGAHPLAQLHRAADDFPGHPKAKPRLHPCPHLTRIFGAAVLRIRPHGHDLDGTHRLVSRRRFGTGGQHCDCQQQRKPQGNRLAIHGRTWSKKEGTKSIECFTDRLVSNLLYGKNAVKQQGKITP